MRRSLVIANRKMYGSLPENQYFLEKVAEQMDNLADTECVVCVPHPYLFQAQSILSGSSVG